jgi:hypothetical protein
MHVWPKNICYYCDSALNFLSNIKVLPLLRQETATLCSTVKRAWRLGIKRAWCPPVQMSIKNMTRRRARATVLSLATSQTLPRSDLGTILWRRHVALVFQNYFPWCTVRRPTRASCAGWADPLAGTCRRTDHRRGRPPPSGPTCIVTIHYSEKILSIIDRKAKCRLHRISLNLWNILMSSVKRTGFVKKRT